MRNSNSTDTETMPISMTGDSAYMVLLVDDQPIIGEAVRRALMNESDIDFHFCSNPLEALESAQRTRPTVILQDLVMPNGDGLALVREYRANPATKDIPIIVLSTKEDPAIKSEAFSAGANDYLVKLPDKIELLARIRYHSKAYRLQLQRDDAYRALRRSQQQLMEANIELQRLNNVDALTEVSNRKHFNEYIEAEWKRALREQSSLSLLLIDVDDFKRYNDTYGHLAGDEVLRKVAQVARASSTRPADLAARFGGEEFGIVLPSTPLNGAQFAGEKVRQNVEELQLPHSDSTVGRIVTVSIGGSTKIPQRGDSLVALVETADRALYEAKRTGKNRVVTLAQ